VEEPLVWFHPTSKAPVEMEDDAQDVSMSPLFVAQDEYRHMEKEDSHHKSQGHRSIGKSSMHNNPVKQNEHNEQLIMHNMWIEL
jgi:hypothetical protein